MKRDSSPYEYLIVSDAHLTSLVAQTEKLKYVLEHYKAKTTVLNGDIVDVNHTQRLKKREWSILSLLSKIAKESNLFWLGGNHDADVSKLLSEFIGCKHKFEHIAIIAGRKIYITHGDKFDSFIGDHPLITNIATGLYYWLQAIDPKEQRIPRFFKKRSKNWIKAAERVKKNALTYAEKNGYTDIICSHTHHNEHEMTEGGITYTNTGCFTYKTCAFVTIDKDGRIEVHEV